jgi:cytochrome P450
MTLNHVPNKPADISFMDPNIQEDWFLAYDILRRDAPVYFMPEIGMYVLTRYEDVKWVISEPQIFTGGPDFRKIDPMLKFPEARSLYEQKGWPRYMPLSENIPLHRRYRSLIDPFFTPAAVKRSEPFIRELINGLIDGWIDRGAVEFIRDFADPLPMTVIAEFLGFPRMDLPQLKEWSYAWVLPESRGLSLEQELWAVNKHIELQHYIHEAAKSKRANPKDDILSHLVTAEYNDEETGETRPLRDEEIIGITDHLLIGGNETTTFALSNGLWLLFRFPDSYRQMEADHTKVGAFVEEVLRMESPTQGLYRYVTEDVEIHGVRIPKGSRLSIRYGAANLDGEQFPEPFKMNLNRKNATSHLAFSQGEHRCPGAALSRLEQNCAWNILLRRLRNIRAVADKNDYTHVKGIWLRALNEIHMQFDKAS